MVLMAMITSLQVGEILGLRSYWLTWESTCSIVQAQLGHADSRITLAFADRSHAICLKKHTVKGRDYANGEPGHADILFCD